MVTVKRLVKLGGEICPNNLLYAIQGGREAVVEILLKKGEDPNHGEGGQKLIISAVQGGYGTITKALYDRGARVPDRILRRPLKKWRGCCLKKEQISKRS